MINNLNPLVDSVLSGQGLYSVSEAAFYAKMPRVTLSTWFFGRSDRSAYREHSLPSDEQQFLTFDEFIEAVAIRSLRSEHNFQLSQILEALTFAEEKWGIKHLFSHPRHRAAIDNKKGIYIYLDEDGDPVQISKPSLRGQKSFHPLVQSYLKLLHFDTKEHLISYKPADSISMQPSICYGEPFVDNVYYPVKTLYDAYLSEGGIVRAANLFEIDEESVKKAVRYWDSLTKPPPNKAA